MQIRYQRVKNGCFSDQQNKEEAKVIAQAVREHFQKHPDETLGVTAMTAKQRDQIKNEVEMLKKKDDLFADQLDKDAKKSEPLFVKNLENVQGDKRDVIFISITYGPKRPGEKVSLLSEPINSEHGGRCLKELRTLPKKRMHVFSSMDSGDILVGQDAKRGVRDWRDFLKDCETGELAMIDKDQIEEDERSKGAAQEVLKKLNDLESTSRTRMSSRWIWELLQNARDTAAGKSTSLTASVEHQEGELTFLHNGSGFTGNQVFRLIYHGSTKVEDKGTIGQFGSGFLTTHLLSSKIDVSGFLNDGQSFEFRLERKTGSIPSIAALLNKAWDDFNPSNKPLMMAMPPGFTTRFAYYPISEDAVKAVEQGIATLKQYAPFVVVFNREFAAVNIKSISGSASFKVERKPLEQNGTQLVTVMETDNETQRERKYLLATGKKSTVAFPLESAGSDNECLPVDNIPRLFLGFPLVGTENFSFPAVINSFRFSPNEHRSGIYLGQGSNQANIDNQEAVEEALDLLVRLLDFAAASNWKNVPLLAEIPDIQNQDWLRKVLMESLIPKIRRTPAVLSKNGAIPPKESKVPFTEASAGDAGVEALWDLVNGLTELRQKLPSRNESVGWCKAVKSWSVILRGKVTDFPEVIDGAKLTSYVEEKAKVTDEDYGRLSHLQTLLQQGESALIWLNRFCGFLKTNGFDEVLRTRSIIPDQSGFLDKLSNLYRDCGISEDLKDIAKSLDWSIRDELRDTRITALADEIGKGDWDDDHVVRDLIKQLQERAEQNPDAAFAEASVRLFTWIVERKSWELLRGFPVFGRRIEPERPLTVIHLPINDQSGDRPMTPVKVWDKELQRFADIFPPASILADDFFAKLRNQNTWQMLAERSLVGKEIIRFSKTDDIKFYPDLSSLQEGEEHSPVDLVPVTDVWRLAEIIERVRNSQDRARLFWQFLTEWLAPKDLKNLEDEQIKCICGDEHRYYPANWLRPLREKMWVRQSNDVRTIATAQSLANLLRGKWDPNSLSEPATVKLLEAMDISRLELLQELLATNPENLHEVNKALTNILASAGNNVTRLNQARQYIEDLKKDKELPAYLDKRREHMQVVRGNQRLGAQVEELVEKILKGKGFIVKRTHVGADYEIQLELARDSKTWLVEVKATRSQRVRMTDTQARTAERKRNRFLLCVVPLDSEQSEPTLDEVRSSMRFVPNIGKRLADLCKDLDSFQNQRDKIITKGDPTGFKLEVESGAAHVRVANSVWQGDDSFPLDELPDHLN